MKKLLTYLIFLIIATVTGCGEGKQSSQFFDDCPCSQIEISGETFKDSLNHFSVGAPEGNWYSSLNLDSNGNGISIGDDNSEAIRMFTITELEKSDTWSDKKNQLKGIQEKFDVIKHGEVSFRGAKRFWYFVKDDSMPNLHVLYINVEHETENRFVTLAIWIEGEDFDFRNICELESILNSFHYN